MAKTFTLDQDRRSFTTAVPNGGVLTCVKTSGDDVYTRGIVNNEKQYDLLAGESMLVDRATLIVRIFSKSKKKDAQFSAEMSLE
jgi:hypothetical protein